MVLVITPAYCTKENGRFPLLLQTIASVAAQDIPCRHLIIDDGSDPPLSDRIHHPEMLRTEHIGPSAAINYALDSPAASDAEYVAILYSDDLLIPNGLSARLDRARSTGAKIVYSDLGMLIEGGTARRRAAPEFDSADALYAHLLAQRFFPNMTLFWDVTFLREIGGYDPRLRSAEDWDVALTAAKRLRDAGGAFALSHEACVLYRLHDRNALFQNARDGTKAWCYERIFKKHLSGALLAEHLAAANRRIRMFASCKHPSFANLPSFPEGDLYLRALKSATTEN